VKKFLLIKKKTIIVWDDAFVNNVPVPDSALIHIWQQEAYMIQAIKAGKQVIRSNGWYLDQAVPGDTRYRWLETWIDFYELEPVPQGLTSEEEALVIGGEACMWTEQVDSHTFSALVWPRTSCTAERLWSNKYVNDSTSAIPRLLAHRCSLHLRGVDASPIFPDYCERDDSSFHPKENTQNYNNEINLQIESIQNYESFNGFEISIMESMFGKTPGTMTTSTLALITAFICGAGVMFFLFLFAVSLRRLFKSSSNHK